MPSGASATYKVVLGRREQVVPFLRRVGWLWHCACMSRILGNTTSEAGSTCHRITYELFQSMPPRNFQE